MKVVGLPAGVAAHVFLCRAALTAEIASALERVTHISNLTAVLTERA